MFKTLLLVATTGLLSSPCVALAAKKYYVSALTGNDKNSGLTTGTAFATLQHAADLTEPGDTVYVMNGTYKIDKNLQRSDTTDASSFNNVLTINRSGAPDSYIEYRAYSNHTPVLSSNGTVSAAISIRASYIMVDGLTVVGNRDFSNFDGSNGKLNILDLATTFKSDMTPWEQYRMYDNGISVMAKGGTTNLPISHIVISNCTVTQCGSAGIAVTGGAGPVDHVWVQGNTVFENCQRNNWAASGINIINLGSVGTYTGTGVKIFVQNNVVFNNRNLLPWYKATDNIFWSDGNGIIIDVSQNYVGRFRVQNNISYNNGGAGISITKSPNAEVIYNTTFGNVRTPELADSYANIMVTGTESINAVVRGNIIHAHEGGRLTANVTTGFTNNLYYKDRQTDVPTDLPGTNNVWGNPLFVARPHPENPAANFRLSSSVSPAVNAGLAFGSLAQDHFWAARPLGGANDLGAVESF